ncbi:MAG TPA: PASTA domain-containing protein [Bacteroidales bacterium]|nr:PASTA domain-containing protein [Bacteroidales bacterium]
MSFFRFLFSKTFLKNLLIAILVTIGLALLTFKLLSNYTFHGQSIPLPDFTGKTPEELKTYTDTYKFRFTVVDSVYNVKSKPGSIITQDPPPNSPVKKRRNVYLTTVAVLPEKIEMPDLRYLSLRQAVSLLETYGLQSGHLTFEQDPDIEQGNLIKNQIFQGETLEPGTLIHKGSTIDLVVGKSVRQIEAPMPLVIGMTLDQASRTLNKVTLNVGKTHFLDEDQQEYYRVYRQDPDYKGNLFVTVGSEVDLWLRSERDFDFGSLIKRYQIPDTLQALFPDEEFIQMDTID